MAKYLFSLETLLRHRENVEQKERDELFQLTHKYQLELRKRDDLASKFQETMKELSLKRAGNSAPQELNWYHLYLNRLIREIGECEKRLSRLQSEIQSKKEAVLEASKKKKTLAAMKAKREKEFMVALERQEQKEVDELVILRYTAKEPEYPQVAENQKDVSDAKNE